LAATLQYLDGRVAMSEGRDIRHASHIGRLVGVGRIGGDAVAQHEIGRLRVRQDRQQDRQQGPSPWRRLP